MFGVTANHVLEAWRNDRKSKKVVALQLAGMPFDPDGRHAIIDAHEGIDIATFRITADEVRSIKDHAHWDAAGLATQPDGTLDIAR